MATKNKPASAIGAVEQARELAAVEIEPDAPTLIMSKEEPKARTDFVVQKKAETEELDSQIKPSFVSMTEEDVQKWLKEMTEHLRDRGATVNTLDVQEIDGLMEAKYQWRYQEDHPVTIVASAKTALDAVRMVAEEVAARRHEV